MEGAVRRWLVDISQWDPSPEQFSFFVSLLPKYEQSAITRFIKLDDRKRALVSRLLQYSLVHEVLDMPYDEINIRRTIEGKPYLILVFEGGICQSFRHWIGFQAKQIGVSSHGLDQHIRICRWKGIKRLEILAF
uniref:holo-[acyl-carrier-protein] synthase n=1 Tax=Anthurium amnicola TaxID=1678845 RepID=A0A1D1XCR8_9ARAE